MLRNTIQFTSSRRKHSSHMIYANSRRIRSPVYVLSIVLLWQKDDERTNGQLRECDDSTIHVHLPEFNICRQLIGPVEFFKCKFNFCSIHTQFTYSNGILNQIFLIFIHLCARLCISQLNIHILDYLFVLHTECSIFQYIYHLHQFQFHQSWIFKTARIFTSFHI